MTSAPLVTAIVPTRDRAELCVRAVTSVLAQTHPNIECIVVDDGSADGTAALLRERFGDAIRIIRHDAPRGVAVARNDALAVAQGEYVAFLDSDDEWLPEKIARQLAVAQRGADVVYCGVIYVKRAGDVLMAFHPRHRGDVFEAMLRENIASGGGSSILVRRACLEKAGRFREGIYSEDWDLWLRLALLCRYDFDPAVLVRIESEPGSRHRAADPEALMASARSVYAALAGSERFTPRLRRRCEAMVAHVGALQFIAREQRGHALRLCARSIAVWPWQLLAYRALLVALTPRSGLAFAKRLRARWSEAAARRTLRAGLKPGGRTL